MKHHSPVKLRCFLNVVSFSVLLLFSILFSWLEWITGREMFRMLNLGEM